MKTFSRFFPILTVLFLTVAFLGRFSNPVLADSTGFLSLINSYRAQNGVGALVEDQNLTNAACWFADDMGAKNYFPSDHVDSQGRSMSQRLTDFGVSGSRAENIFYTTQGSSANYAFDAWENSSGHNTNMLSGTYTRIGIGRANYSGRWYWVTDFANGSANALANQCGISVAPPPPPPVAKKPPPPPPAAVETPTTLSPIETQIATTTATVSAKTAPKSATTSTKIVKIDSPTNKRDLTLVQGVTATTIVFGNLALLAFLTFKLYRHRHFLR